MVNIFSAAISSVSIYDDEVTRYRVRECRAFECKRSRIHRERRFISSPTQVSSSIKKISERGKEKKKKRETIESSDIEYLAKVDLLI